jgi:hypothetical protein
VSYDLSIRPRPGSNRHAASVADAAAAIEAAGARPISGNSQSFRIQDQVAGEATADLVCAGSGVQRVEVSLAATNGIPGDIYLFCATVARRLSWSVFDPQGDCWYSPGDLERAANAANNGDDTLTVGVRTLLSGAALLALAVVWVIKGLPKSRVWVAMLLIAAAVTLGARLWDYLESRHRRRDGAG